jgi:RHS repeat-associated protein
MEMAGRGFSGSYRFGYQGSEKDNEVSGDGNSYTTEFRQLDPRLGRWFSCDRELHPYESPYTSMDNDPINLVDIYGLSGENPKQGDNSNGNYVIHKVKGGQSLGKLAKLYGVSIKAIKEANKNRIDWNSDKRTGEKKDWIYADENLIIPPSSEKEASQTTNSNATLKDAQNTGQQQQAGAFPLGVPTGTPGAPMKVIKGPKTTPGSGNTPKGSPSLLSVVLSPVVMTVGAVLLPANWDQEPYDEVKPINFNDPRFNPNKEQEDKDLYVTLYRGVGDKVNPRAQFEYALDGLAVHKGFIPQTIDKNFHTNLNDHTFGNNFTPFTSWSYDKEFAKTAALYESNMGVILTIRVKKEELLVSTASQSPLFSYEGEVLLFGVKVAEQKEIVTK